MKIKLFLLSLLLSGCSLLPQQFDNNEFHLLATIETEARLMNCQSYKSVNYSIDILHYKTELLTTYTKYTPKNNELHEIAKILRDDINELKYQHDIGDSDVVYCSYKKHFLINKVQQALKTTGKKIRK